jgi:hypothetical protein
LGRHAFETQAKPELQTPPLRQRQLTEPSAQALHSSGLSRAPSQALTWAMQPTPQLARWQAPVSLAIAMRVRVRVPAPHGDEQTLSLDHAPSTQSRGAGVAVTVGLHAPVSVTSSGVIDSMSFKLASAQAATIRNVRRPTSLPPPAVCQDACNGVGNL